MTTKAPEIRKLLDEAYLEVEKLLVMNSAAKIVLPERIQSLMNKWNYGVTGWTSPLNILLTASWYKWLNPNQDICIIWSENGNGDPIPGGYSVRSYDEGFTVPLVTKNDLYKEFCSSNSGMQGARSLEKARGIGRINPNGEINQKVRYDLKLFAETLNEINRADSALSKKVFQSYLLRATKIKLKRLEVLKKLLGLKPPTETDSWVTVRQALRSAKDPQLVKTIAATCLHSISRNAGYKVGGLDSAMTGADARSGGPGDLYLSINGKPRVGIEIKDESRKIGFSILSAVRERILKNNLSQYIVIVDSQSPLEDEVREDPEWLSQIDTMRSSGCPILILGLEQLWNIARVTATDPELIEIMTDLIPKTSSLKKGTAECWITAVSSGHPSESQR
jgi:hypothetical protein